LLGRASRIGSLALLGGGTSYTILVSNREKVRNDSPVGWTDSNANVPPKAEILGSKTKNLPSSGPYNNQLDTLRHDSKLDDVKDATGPIEEEGSAWATFTHRFGVTGD